MFLPLKRDHRIHAGETDEVKCALGIFAKGDRKVGWITYLYKANTAMAQLASSDSTGTAIARVETNHEQRIMILGSRLWERRGSSSGDDGRAD